MKTELNVLHVVPRWNHGGPAAGLVLEAKHAKLVGSGISHRVLALEPGGSSAMVREALRARLRLHPCPPHDEEAKLVRDAHVVVLHYWNTPSLRRFLDRWRGAPLRWMLTSHVNGLHRPQLLPPALGANAGHVVLTSHHLHSGFGPGRATVIPAIADLSEANADAAAGADGPIVHVGTLNVFKLSPHFVPLHAASADPARPVLMGGSGGDEGRFQAEAAELGVADAFRWLGFVSDVPALLAGARLFSCPVSRFSYATSDKVLQVAQASGVPVLVQRDAPVAHLVRDGVSGILAEDLADFARKLAAIADGSLDLPSRAAVREAALEDHDPAPKHRKLEAIYRGVEAGGARPLDDGFADLPSWIDFQVGDAGELREARRPSLAALRDDEVLARHQRWGCEGGLAQALNAFPELAGWWEEIDR